MDELMKNPAMMSMMDAMMNDPQMQEIMQKPEIMAKFSGLMDGTTNPAAIMSDPELMKIMTKMQQLQMGMLGTGTGTGASAASSSSSGASDSALTGVIHLSSPNQFHTLMEKSKTSKLPLVIDYFATWCGPCKMIAPVFEELASSYSGRAIFLKVDGDRNRAITSAQGVRGFPTFQVWKDGNKVEEWAGADANRLRSAVESHAADDPVAASASSKARYRHFPVQDAELAIYPKIKWELVTPKLKENNSKLAAATDETVRASALSDEQMKIIEKVIDALNDRLSYHSQVWNDQQLDAVQRVLRWPIALAGPAMHFFRLFILHPGAAQYYAKQLAASVSASASASSVDSKESDSSKGFDVVAKVCDWCIAADSPALLTTGLWCLSNLFSKMSMQRVLSQRYELILETVNALLKRKECADLADNEANILSAIGVLINLAFVLSMQQNQQQQKDASSANSSGKALALESKVLEQAKVQLLSAALEAADKYQQRAKVVYRLFVILGTLLLDDANLTELAADLELTNVMLVANKLHSHDKNVTDAAQELKKLVDAQARKK